MRRILDEVFSKNQMDIIANVFCPERMRFDELYHLNSVQVKLKTFFDERWA